MTEELKPIILELKNVRKSFGQDQVLKGIDIQIREGEFVTLLGSSGCGKTTTLRIIAGLEDPDEGEVLLSGKDMKHMPPEKRNVNTVFQNYALFPHMNVFQNIAYGLKLQKLPKEEIKEKVTQMLELVQLEGFEKRMPLQMSGGQRQRIAIARALVKNPKVLLLDEPLGALDLQLRRQMQLELKRLQKKLGITFIYITHDQEEALNMSDKIAVMRDGYFEQIGTPAQIYEEPKTSFVATFVGNANICQGICKEVKDSYMVLENVAGLFLSKLPIGEVPVIGKEYTVAIRSENVMLDENNSHILKGTVAEKSFAGGMLRIQVTLTDGKELVISRHGINIDLKLGDTVALTWNPEHAVPVDLEQGKA